MTHLRSIFCRFILICATLVTALHFPALAFGQQPPDGMDRSGTVGIQNDTERRVFGSLLCTCGCPREALSTCTCGFARDFREEVRGMLGRGMSMEQIQNEWVRLHGSQALVVPPNTGANRFLYLTPLAVIAGMAAFVIVILRRFRRREQEAASVAATAASVPLAGGGTDDYDRKLDDELELLDRE